MGDLSTILPTVTETVQRIYDWHKQQGDAEPARGYLGASVIGHHCDRYLWYTFRGCVARDFDGRLYRLFETGDLAEPRFVAELRAIGCEVCDTDDDGNQFAVYALGGHVSGHMDGSALGVPEAPQTWHVCEFKTHNAKSYAQLATDGVQKSKPMHYAQMQVYMGLTGMKRALYLAVNKDTDELYSERVRYDAKAFKALMGRAERIITTNTPPERAASRSDYWECKFCDAHSLCWGLTDEAAVPIPARTCRTCCHATPANLDRVNAMNALWTCAKLEKGLTPTEQNHACDGHLLLPGLVSFASPNDAGDNWIEFQNHADGAHWRHGQEPGMWSTVELMKSPSAAVGDKGVAAVKELFDGECEGPTPLVDLYPPSTSELLWNGPPAGLAEAVEGLGLGSLASMTPTRTDDHDGVIATEFMGIGGGRDILIVVYAEDHVAAIWEGKS